MGTSRRRTRTQTRYAPPITRYDCRWQSGVINYRQARWEWVNKSTQRGEAMVDSETIIDRVGDKNRPFHPVYHEKVKHTLLGAASWRQDGPPKPGSDAIHQTDGQRTAATMRAYYNENVTRAPNGYSLIPGKPGALAPSIDWRAALEALMDDAHGLLPAQKSLAVNVAEFTQVKRLVPGISKSIARLVRWVKGQPNRKIRISYKRRTRNGWTVKHATVRLRSLKWSLADLADLHLAYSFGVAPLASDLGELSGKLWEVIMHQNWWRTISDGRHHHLMASREWTTSSDPTLASRGPGFRVLESFSQTSKGTLGAEVEIKPVTEEIEQRRLFQQIIGWNVPLSIAWELVPFSFVVDWFVPVGDVLNRFEPKRFLGSLAANVTVFQRWHSVKTEARLERQLVADPSTERAPVSYNPWPGIRISSSGGGRTASIIYERNYEWPDMNFTPKGQFTFKQAGLSLSLVVARLFR